MILNRINEFYNNLFLYHYSKLKYIEDEPIVMPIVYISFCQVANFLILVIIIYFTTDLNTQIDKEYIPILVFPLYFLFSAINLYKYDVKKGGEKLLARGNEINKKMKFYSIVYLILSISAPLLLIYYFNEIY